MLWEKKPDTVNLDGKEYVFACKSYEVKEGRGKRVELEDDIDLAVFRVEGNLYCVSNICPHNLHPDIYDGLVQGKTVSCPFHNWTFSLETGKHIEGGKGLNSYSVIEQNGKVYIEKPVKRIPKWMQTQIDE